MTAEYHKFKVLIIGDTGVGKTSLIIQHADRRFAEQVSATIGVDFKQKLYIRDSKRYDLFVWDTAGQERFRNVVTAYYRDAHAALVVFDVTKRESFEHVSYWIADIRKRLPDIILILVGNKIDLPSARAVTHEEISKVAANLGLNSYIETSAKDGTAVDSTFDLLLERLITKHTDKHVTADTVIKLGQGTKNTTKKACC